MKINVEVDTTPEELRHFLGLPDVAELQAEMIETLRQNMRAGMEGFDPISLLKPFLPENLKNLSSMQKQFWETMINSASSKK